MSNVRWIVPEAKEPASAAPRDSSATAPASSARRIRLGLLDNSKDNAQMLLRLIAERVRRELDAGIVERRKNAATLAAPDETLEKLAREADCVLTAMAD